MDRFAARAKKWFRTNWVIISSWAISAAALWYVLSQIDWSLLKKELAGVTWWLFGAAIFLQIVPRALGAIRWQALLRPLSTRFAQLFQAIYIGTLYSAILPLSMGDAVRAVVVAREARTTFTRVFSTEVLERVTDAVTIILVVWFALRGQAIPQALRIVRTVLEVAVGSAIVLGLAVTVRRTHLIGRLKNWRPSNRLGKRLRSVGLDLVRAIGWVSPWALGVASAAAVMAAVANIISYWLMLHAYHLRLSPVQAAGLFAIVTIGTFLPNTPGDIGSWQFFSAIGLQMFGASAAQAAGFSLVAWAAWTIPPMLMGAIALLTSSFEWSELRRSEPPKKAPLEPGTD